MADDGVDLAEVIRQVRGDLELAMWAGEDKNLGFIVGEVEFSWRSR